MNDTSLPRLPEDLPADATMSYNAKRKHLEEVREATMMTEAFPRHPVEPVPDKEEPVDETNLTMTQWRLTNAPTALSPMDVDTDPAAALSDGSAAAFTMIDIVGRGGFGEVWSATQQSLGRVVAVKKLREHVYEKASAETIEREFRQEAVVTARLEHPNIVPVYDLGMDERNRPVLAMKLVRGKPWDKVLAEDQGLTREEFFARHLPTLIAVTQAVGFAHSRGIVHRDLKPSQVMIGKYGEVVLMDWGLALQFEDPNSLETNTRIVQLPQGAVATLQSATCPSGTPAFMAPEQTEESARNIGPWTDVYLLGGILYFMLTNTPPHHSSTAQQAFIKAMNGVVQEPHERAPDREIPTELADLAMRALDPDRGNRLSSADAFLQGIQSYLSGSSRRRESIGLVWQARSKFGDAGTNYGELTNCLSLLERAQNLWNSNPEVGPLREQILHRFVEAAIDNGDLVLARLNAERVADDEGRRLLIKGIDEKQREIDGREFQRRALIYSVVVLLAIMAFGGMIYVGNLREQRERAEATRTSGDDLIQFMLFDVGSRLEDAGRLDLMEETARRALRYYDELAQKDITETALRQRARALSNLSRVLADRNSAGEQEAMLREFHKITQDLANRSRDNLVWRSDLSRSYRGLWQIAANNKDWKVAENQARQALKIAEELISQAPNNAEYLWHLSESYEALAEALGNQGDADGAIAALKAALPPTVSRAQGDAKRATWKNDLAQLNMKLGAAYQGMGRDTDAAAAYLAAFDASRELVAQEPWNERWRRTRALAGFDYGNFLAASGQPEQALAAYREVQTSADRLVEDHPDLAGFHSEYAGWMLSWAAAASQARKPEEAERILKRALAAALRNVELSPGNAAAELLLANVRLQIGKVLSAMGKREDSERYLQTAANDATRLASANKEPIFRFREAQALAALAAFQAGAGKADKALQNLAKADAAFRNILATGLPGENVLAAWRGSMQSRTDILVSAGKNDVALSVLEEALAVLNAADESDDVSAVQCEVYRRRGDLFRALGKDSESIAAWRQSAEAFERTKRRDPADTNAFFAYRSLAAALLAKKEYAAARKPLETALSLLADAETGAPGSISRRDEMAAYELAHILQRDTDELEKDIAFLGPILRELNAAATAQADGVSAMLDMARVHRWMAESAIGFDAAVAVRNSGDSLKLWDALPREARAEREEDYRKEVMAHARTLLAAGDAAGARTEAEKALGMSRSLEPAAHAAALALAAHAAEGAGDAESSLRYSDEAIALLAKAGKSPEVESARLSANVARGLALARSGDADGARKAFTDAIEGARRIPGELRSQPDEAARFIALGNLKMNYEAELVLPKLRKTTLADPRVRAAKSLAGIH